MNGVVQRSAIPHLPAVAAHHFEPRRSGIVRRDILAGEQHVRPLARDRSVGGAIVVVEKNAAGIEQERPESGAGALK